MKRVFLFLPAAAAVLLGCARYAPQQPTSVLPLTSGSISAKPLDDGAVASIAISIADGQAARAREAQREAHDPRVLALAGRILDEAPASNIRTMSLAPRSSVLQDEVTTATRGDLGYLSTTRGLTFERAFIDAERQSLAGALELLDDTLIPTAVNLQLKHSLEQMRDTLESELHEVRFLAVTLPPLPNAGGLR